MAKIFTRFSPQIQPANLPWRKIALLFVLAILFLNSGKIFSQNSQTHDNKERNEAQNVVQKINGNSAHSSANYLKLAQEIETEGKIGLAILELRRALWLDPANVTAKQRLQKLAGEQNVFGQAHTPVIKILSFLPANALAFLTKIACVCAFVFAVLHPIFFFIKKRISALILAICLAFCALTIISAFWLHLLNSHAEKICVVIKNNAPAFVSPTKEAKITAQLPLGSCLVCESPVRSRRLCRLDENKQAWLSEKDLRDFVPTSAPHILTTK